MLICSEVVFDELIYRVRVVLFFLSIYMSYKETVVHELQSHLFQRRRCLHQYKKEH